MHFSTDGVQQKKTDENKHCNIFNKNGNVMDKIISGDGRNETELREWTGRNESRREILKNISIYIKYKNNKIGKKERDWGK